MKYAIVFLAVLLVSAVPVQAQLPDPGMTPDHPLFFMDKLFDVFRSPANVADERAAEVLAMEQEDNQRGLERAQEAYRQAMERRQRALENNPQLAEEVARQSTEHATELAKRERLEKSLAVGTENREAALKRLEALNPERAALVAQDTLEQLLAQLPDEQFERVRQAVREEEQARRFDEQVQQYLSYEEVQERVAGLYPEDEIVEAEREMRRGILIYKLELRSGIELYMNGRTGELLSVEQDDDDFYEQDDDDRFESRISVEEAERYAREVVGDIRLLEVDSDVEDGRSVYEFEFVGDIEVSVDALTGEVVEVEPFQAEVSVDEVRGIVSERYPEASILELELEDDGYYEVELSNDVELYIDATSGDILRVEDDSDEYDADNDEYSDDDEDSDSPSEDMISRAEAARIALERYPDASVEEVEFDDDGYFEVELSNGFEVKIDAYSGDILEIDD